MRKNRRVQRFRYPNPGYPHQWLYVWKWYADGKLFMTGYEDPYVGDFQPPHFF
jgi:hypothetical protein